MKHHVLMGLLVLAWSMPLPMPAHPTQQAPAGGSLPERIAHTDASKYRRSPAVHGGAGHLDFMGLLSAAGQDSHFYFLHRGVILPKSGLTREAALELIQQALAGSGPQSGGSSIR